jgi:hypothetical protein
LMRSSPARSGIATPVSRFATTSPATWSAIKVAGPLLVSGDEAHGAQSFPAG